MTKHNSVSHHKPLNLDLTTIYTDQVQMVHQGYNNSLRASQVQGKIWNDSEVLDVERINIGWIVVGNFLRYHRIDFKSLKK